MTRYPDTARVDARDKVLGTARYGADDARPNMLHGAFHTAPIGKGRITAIDVRAARAAPGVKLVLTHDELGDVKPAGYLMAGGYACQSIQPLLGAEIAYRGQPVAFVAADTWERAVHAASLVEAHYDAAPFNALIASAPASDVIAQHDSPLPKQMFADRVVGDAGAAFAAAPIQVDAMFTTTAQHQNPIELLACVAEWHDGALTVHEGTQNAEAVRHGLAKQLGIPAERIQVISPFIGGGFGQKNSEQMHTVIAAVAAQRTGQPVKLVVPRAQIYHDTSFRPASRHRVRLAADRAGRMTAALHEVHSQTSRHDLFPTQYTEVSSRLYGIPAFRGRESLVRTDVPTPGYMRAPFEHMAALAIECAVDELAEQLRMDPVELRLLNDTTTDPLTGRPLSSRHVAACLRRGAARFGWAKRSPAPGSMRASDGSQIGWGVAIGAYKAATAPAIARLRASRDGRLAVSVAGHEMGQGIRSAIANAAAQRLGAPIDAVDVIVGDTRAVAQHLTAGSWGTATAVPAVLAACDALIAALRELDASAPPRAFARVLRAAGRTTLDVEGRHKAPGQPDAVYQRLQQGLPAAAGPSYPEFTSFSYIAHFIEVRIEPTTRRIRVPRIVSVADCGTVVSPRTAASQVRSGVVWGIGAALRESTEVDPRFGGVLNADLAEYAIAVNADIGDITVDFIDQPDPRLNPAGVKGLGEVVMVGVAPAIINAIHHATGRRLRDLPIRIEHLL